MYGTKDVVVVVVVVVVVLVVVVAVEITLLERYAVQMHNLITYLLSY